MKVFLKPKLIFPLVTMVLLTGAIVGSLAGNFIGVHAQAICCSIAVSPTSGPIGTKVTVTGAGWTAGEAIDISFFSATAHATAANNGTFTTSFTVPSDATLGTTQVDAINASGDETAQAPFTVTSAPTPTRTPNVPNPTAFKIAKQITDLFNKLEKKVSGPPLTF